MYRFRFIGVSVLCLMLSCNEHDDKKPVDEKVIKEETSNAANNTQLITSYTEYINQLDTTEAASVSEAAQKFKELFENADTTGADSAFVLFDKVYNRIGSYLNEQHLKDGKDYTSYLADTLNKGQNNTTETNAYVKQLKDNGYTLDMSEGMTYIKQKRSFLSGYFYPYVSHAMKQYLVKYDKDNDEGFIEDAGLMITPVQLSERLIWWENFMRQYPDFYYNQEIKETNRGYLTFLLEGIDNSPLFDYSSGKLSEAYKAAYQNILQKYPLSTLASVVKPYFDALQKNDVKARRELLRQYKKQGFIYDYSG